MSSYFKLKLFKRKRNENALDCEINNKTTTITTLLADNNCRICLKIGTIPIFDPAKPEITEAIRAFGEIEIFMDDYFPKLLCNSCLSLLQGAMLFKQTAKQTDSLLREYIKQRPQSISRDTLSPEPVENELSDHFEDLKINHMFCKLCNISFDDMDTYMKHKSSKRHKNVRVQCSVCKRLLTAQSYTKHLSGHQNSTDLICEYCGKMFRKDNLIRHLRLHSLKLPFQCEICPYRGRFLESLKIHKRTHTGSRPYSCEKCSLHFLTKSNLNRHMLTHGKEKPFNCKECHRGFYTKRDADLHFKSDHVGLKDFNCKLCGSKYGTKKSLMRHEIRVHKRVKKAKGRMPLYLQDEYKKINE